MALDTVADYIADARVLLQDQYAGGYRYTDAELVTALNHAFLEMRRLRPDMFIAKKAVPSYSAASTATAVDCDIQYRVSLLYYICGRAELKDDEPTQDTRATAFINKFTAQLLVLQS